MAKQRIAYLDIVKLFTIYLVILGHSIQMMVNGLSTDKHLWPVIYSFHMPLFMLLSGYFVSGKLGEQPFIEVIKKKSTQLLLPAITCTVICCVYLCCVKENPNYRDEIIGNSWFLKTLFVYYVLFYLLKQIHMNEWILFIVSCLLLFVFPHASSLQANLLFPYFWGGYLMRKYNVLERFAYFWYYAVAFVLLFICLYTLQCYWHIPNYIEINIDSLQHKFHLILFRYLVGFSGCLATIATISAVYKTFENNPRTIQLAKYGQWTLGVYVLQTILVTNVFPDILAWYVESEILLDVIIAPLLSLAFLVLCLFLIYIISKNKKLDLLFFGGQYYNK